MKHFAYVMLLTLPCAAIADTEVRGNIRELLAVDTQHDDPVEHFYQGDLRLFGEGRYTTGPWSLTASVLARYTSAYPRDNHHQFDLELYEGYARWAQDALSVEMGQRVLRWGVMEYVSPTDAINPRDLRQFIDEEIEDTYIPVPMIRAVFERRPWTFEAVYQPFFRPSRYELVGSDMAAYRPSLAAHFGFPYVDLASSLDDDTENDIVDLIGNEPDFNMIRGEGGVRVAYSYDPIDVGILYLSKRETAPSFDFPTGANAFSPAQIASTSAVLPTQGDFPRNNLAGATVRGVLDNGITFKGEVLFQHRTSLYDPNLFLSREQTLQWAAGAEYDYELRHLFILEYAEDRVVSGSLNDYFLRDGTQRTVSGAAILKFDADRWIIELKGMGIVNQGAYLARPRLLYKPSPTVEFALGANFWGGSDNSVFGLLSNNDQIFTSVKYLF